jgi:hypothetical protein
MENGLVNNMYTVSHQHIAGRGIQEKQEILQEKKLIGNPNFLQGSHLNREASNYFPHTFTRLDRTFQIFLGRGIL